VTQTAATDSHVIEVTLMPRLEVGVDQYGASSPLNIGKCFTLVAYSFASR
jgi:hypothetical protein